VLIEFRVENHRSIGSEQVLGLQATTRETADSVSRLVAGLTEQLLPAVALYGANASGKTNVLRALEFMSDAVTTSYRRWDPEEGVPREAFAWGKMQKEPSTFEAHFVIDGIRHEYGFVADDLRFLEEWLFVYPNGRKQAWFERDGDEFKFSENFRGENATVKEVTRPNALFLSTAAQLQHKQLLPIFHWFRRILSFDILTVGRARNAVVAYRGLPPTLPYWLRRSSEAALSVDEERDEKAAKFRQLLRQADVGILDFRIEPAAAVWSGDENESVAQPIRDVEFLHKSSAHEAWLPLDQESDGTRTLVSLAPGIIDALRLGSVLLVDELESSLHPLLAMKLIQLFNDPKTNPKNAQIIFTTHDTNLLGNVAGDALLRRDQIWLTEKNDEGATTLYPLADYKPRKAENLERGYLQGRYGAIPFLGPLLPEER
jgi:predicted ATPase